MQLIRTGIQLGQAVRNVRRLRQIVAVFIRYGFADVVSRMNLKSFTPKSSSIPKIEKTKTTSQRLRLAFEELGPTFVKLGQLLSTRPDIIPSTTVEELRHLQDNVLPLNFSIIRGVIEKELGLPLEKIFTDFSEEPLGSASIAQVHEARLLTGERVVVKVQRPEIRQTIENDISLLAFIANLLEKYIPEARAYSPNTVVEEFFRVLSFELNFRIEANNINRISENMAEVDDIVIPKVYLDYSSERVLTLQKLEGIRANNLKEIKRSGADVNAIVRLGARFLFKSILIDGLFHGDLHAGNLFILPGNRLGVIDFGIVGRLSEKAKDQLLTIVISLVTEDFETLCYIYAELGATNSSIDFDSFQREVRNTISPYIGLPLEDVDSGQLLIESTRIATRYGIRVPGDFMLVFKSIMMIEGLGRSLAPGFDLMQSAHELMNELVKHRYSKAKLKREIGIVGQDALSLLKILPRQLRWMLRKLNSDGMAMEIRLPQIERIFDQVQTSSRRVGGALIGAASLISSNMTLQMETAYHVGGYPILSLFYFILGIVFIIRFLVF